MVILALQAAVVRDDGVAPLSLCWPHTEALRLSWALGGALGDSAATDAWRFVIAQMERAHAGEFDDGEWSEIDAPPAIGD